MPSEVAPKFIDWLLIGQHSINDPSEVNPHHALMTIEFHAGSKDGREMIARLYLSRVRDILRNPQTEREAREAILSVENLIQCFPEDERFIEPVRNLRATLSSLAQYEGPPPYTGPRPTRFERLLNPDG